MIEKAYFRRTFWEWLLRKPRKLMLEWQYQKGKSYPHGVCKGWYASGQLFYDCEYQNGKMHNIYKRWNEDGYLEREEYWLYDEEVTEEEYRKHELITELAGIGD